MKINEVAQKYEISTDTLRYYERIGLLPAVHRTESGIRDYDEHDCGWVEFIRCMRSAGISIESLIEYVALCQKGDSTIPARKQILIDERMKLINRLAEDQKTLERLNYKIDNYEKIFNKK